MGGVRELGSGALRVPPLPPFFSEDAARASVEALKKWSRGSGLRGAVTGGKGGMGKTVAAIAFARDPEVQLAFDATLWLTVGRGAPVAVLVDGLKAALRELGGALEDKGGGDKDGAVVCALRGALEGSRTLLVVDDVAVSTHKSWSRGEQFRLLRACVPLSGNSKLLVTTRDMKEWEEEVEMERAQGRGGGGVRRHPYFSRSWRCTTRRACCSAPQG